MKLVFFGSSEFSVYVLDELLLHKIKPDLIVTTPDKPKGRKLLLTPTPVKIWAQDHQVEVVTPPSLKKENAALISRLSALAPQLFLVASYGKIIPKEIFEIAEHKTLNIHPSLLPKYRGASPIQSQILNDEKEIGVTIIQIDEEMDHGPIVIQKKTLISEETWPLSRKELEKILAMEGAQLFAHILPEWLKEAIDPIMQKESEATYCEKIEKSDGEIDLEIDPYKTLLKIKAFEEWPTAYFFTERAGKRIRVIVTDAILENGQFKILKVIPEGKKEMSYDDFFRGKR